MLLDFPTDKQVDAYIERVRVDYELTKKKLEKERSWKINDVRIVIFTKGIRVMNGIQIGLSHLHIDLRRDTWWEKKYPNDVITPENKRLLCDDFDNFLRSGLISDVFGIFESTTRVLAGAYSPKIFSNLTINFSRIYPRFLKELSLNQFIPLIQIWSNIRNSVHNDGMFIPPKPENQDIVYDGDTYLFRVGKPVIHAGWKDLCELSYELGKATYQIVTSDKISSISFIEEPGSKYWNLKNKSLKELKTLYEKES